MALAAGTRALGVQQLARVRHAARNCVAVFGGARAREEASRQKYGTRDVRRVFLLFGAGGVS